LFAISSQMNQKALHPHPRASTMGEVTTVVSVFDAKSQLSALLARAEAGEDIVIARHGRPVVQLVAVPARADRVLGRAGDTLWVSEDFDEPLPSTDDWYSEQIEPA